MFHGMFFTLLLGAAMFKQTMAFLIFFVFLSATGFAQTFVLTREGESFTKGDESRVLLMPLDIQLYEKTTGKLQPKADWTASAVKNVTEAIQQELKTLNDTVILYKEPAEGSSAYKNHRQLIKLHETVAVSILRHQYPDYWQLPTKSGNFEWTLGQGARKLQEKFAADYGLFVHVWDSYTSAELVAISIPLIPFALLGADVPSLVLGQQVGFASLVDLQTGDIIWFNKIFSVSGDVRGLRLARDFIRTLLAGFPL